MATPLEQLEGKYELLEKIREGGMGSVYKVRHELLDEVRVIKVMRPQLADDENLKMRFLREAKMAIRLRHPNLAQIYDFTMDENGYAYLVMEYIDGLDLQEIIKVLGKPSPGLVLKHSGRDRGRRRSRDRNPAEDRRPPTAGRRRQGGHQCRPPARKGRGRRSAAGARGGEETLWRL